jgi:DNA segregation ATPase FtsK/SpoIIIE-like protein
MDSRQPFYVGIGHVLIAGVTGLGKGGALWSIVMALTPLRDAGLAQFYGIDPKRAELVGVSDAFVRVEYDPAGAAAVLDDVLTLMDERKQLGQRTFAASAARPFVFLVIDELPGLLLDPDTTRRKKVVEMLNLIGSQGRSLGVYLIAATQQVQKEVLGQLRGHFQNRIALRCQRQSRSIWSLVPGRCWPVRSPTRSRRLPSPTVIRAPGPLTPALTPSRSRCGSGSRA